MESFKEYKEIEISKLDFISEDAKKFFQEHNILTMEHFLGATRGLTQLNLLQDLQEFETLLEAFREFLPEELIIAYAEFENRHATGLLKPKDDENSK